MSQFTSNSNLRNPYPAISLRSAWDTFERLRKREQGNGPFDRTTLIINLGYSLTTSRVNNIIGSLIHYGLIRRVEAEYYVTKLANDLEAADMDGEEWKSLSLQAAVTPKLFKRLYDRFKGELPLNIGAVLTGNYSVPEDKVLKVIRSYSDSLAFAGYSAVSAKPVAPPPLPTLDSKSPQLQGPIELKEYHFPLSDGKIAIFTLPPLGISNEDSERIANFIKALVISKTS